MLHRTRAKIHSLISDMKIYRFNNFCDVGECLGFIRNAIKLQDSSISGLHLSNKKEGWLLQQYIYSAEFEAKC